MWDSPAGKMGGRRCARLFLTWSQSGFVTWKNYFSLCLDFPERKQGLQLVSMAAVLPWIQSGWKILLLDCVRGDFRHAHICSILEDYINCQAKGNKVHCSDTAGKRKHILMCSSPETYLCFNFPNLVLLGSSPANFLCNISLTWASSSSALCLFVAGMNCKGWKPVLRIFHNSWWWGGLRAAKRVTYICQLQSWNR